MILGRPTNLWLGLVTAGLAFAQISIVSFLPSLNPAAVATVLGGLGVFLGSVITLVANQPPTVTQGDLVHVITTDGQPNKTVVAK
jgi:hypothetical protein